MSGATNQEKTRAEAQRLLGSVVVPPGSVSWTSPPPTSLSGPVMGGSAWSDASVEIGVAAAAPDTSIVRADGIALWIDSVPLRDTQPGPRMRITLSTGCPAGDQGFYGVTNPPPALDASLLPDGSPTGGLVCQYYGLNGHPFALEQKAALDSAAATAFSVRVGQLELGHLEGTVTSCPADDGSVTVVALVYPDGKTFDLWLSTTGCPVVSNGYISASGTVPTTLGTG